MGYSTNPKVLESRRAWLVALEQGKAERWTVDDPRETQNTAYKIREALYIASIHPQDYPALAAAYAAFTIVVTGPGSIEARLRPSSQPTPVGNDGPQVVIHGPGPSVPSGVSTVGLTTADQVITAWKAHLPLNDPMNFPQTSLPLEELVRLNRWALDWRPPLMLIVGQGYLTVALHNPDMDDLRWKAPKPAPQEEPDYGV